MKNSAVILLSILLLTSIGFADDNLGARPAGMGGAFTGLADDVNAIYVNPAGLGSLNGEYASFSTRVGRGTEYTNVGGVEKTKFGVFGVGYISSSFTVDDISASYYADKEETAIKTFNQTLVLSYAREFNDFMVVPQSMGRLAFGANLKFISSHVNVASGMTRDNGSGMNVDLAMVFKPNDIISLGMNLKDLANQDGLKDNLSTGVAGKFLNRSITVSADGQRIGVEWKPLTVIAIRAGMEGDYRSSGIGINLDGLGVDYAYVQKEKPVHYVSVSIGIERSEPIKTAGLNME